MSNRITALLLGTILLLGALLLFINLDKYDIWGDEVLTFPKGKSLGEVIKYTQHVGGTVHPPTYSLLQFIWTKGIAGYDLANNRFLWALFTFMSLPVIFFLGTELFSRKVGLVTAFVCITSPFLIQYSRMIRYYSLSMLLALLTIWAFFRLKRTGKGSDWIFFTLAGVAFVYEDYLAVVIFFFLYLTLFLRWKANRYLLGKFVLAGLVMLILFLPWLPSVFAQMGGGMEPYPEHVDKFLNESPGMAQKGLGLRSVVVNSILKGGFTAYIFMLGETIYPWSWIVSVPVLLSFAVLFFMLVFRGSEGEQKTIRSNLLIFTAVLVAIIFVSELFGPFGSRMFQFPSKVMFLAPLFFLLTTAVWFRLKNRILQALLAVCILASHVYGLSNYYNCRQILNPKYLAPWRQVQADIDKAGSPVDLILTDEEALLHNLHVSNFKIEDYGLVGSIEKVQKTLEERGEYQVFLVIRFRGDQTIYWEGLNVRECLMELYSWVDTWNYLPSDPEANPFWKRILGTEPPEHIIQVFVFNIIEPSEGSL